MPIKPAIGDLVRLNTCAQARLKGSAVNPRSVGLVVRIDGDEPWFVVRWLSHFDKKAYYRRTEVEVVKRMLSA